jgi:hypothetical protein
VIARLFSLFSSTNKFLIRGPFYHSFDPVGFAISLLRHKGPPAKTSLIQRLQAGAAPAFG